MKKNFTYQTKWWYKAVLSTNEICTKLNSKALTLCFVVLLSVSSVYAQKNITLNVSNAPFSTVMQQIEKQSGYTFFYNSSSIQLDRTISISVANKDIRATLGELFKNSGITFAIDDKSIILTAMNDKKQNENRDARLIGKVVDKNGMPIIGATVVVVGNVTTGTTTDVNGMFYLPYNSKMAKATLDVSYIGYEPKTVAVMGKTSVTVVLAEDNKQIETVVVTALGIKKQERAVTYNVQTVSNDVFKTKEANLINSLSGKIAGLQINASAAGAGGETKVVMRGTKSIANSNGALYVLDGIPMPVLSQTKPGSLFSILREQGVTGDGISNINPDDIESMSILTGPSAAALYGASAANGVVMINTRTGEDGVSLTYSNNTTFMSPFWTPEFQNSYGAKTGYYSSWGEKLNSPQSWSPTDFFQTGYNTTNSVGLSFGKDNSKTYLSASSVDAAGLIPNNEYGRYNFTANHTASFLKDKMQLSLNGMYINTSEQNMLADGQYYNPLVPIYLMSPGDAISKYSVYERYDASRNFPVQYWPWGSQSLQMQNPYWITNRNMFETAKKRFLFGSSLKYDIADWLNVSARARIDYNNTTAEQKNYASTLGLFSGYFGRYYNNLYTTQQIYGDVMANINKSFFNDKISLTATIGAGIEDMKYRASLIGGDLTGVANLFTYANMDAGKSFSKVTYNDQTQSLFATAQVGYNRMVFLDLSVRNDWVSALANTNNKSMLYPSVGVSGILTDIFKIDSKVLSFLKLRASYAEVGNAPMRYITIPTYTVSSGNPQTMTYLTSDNFEPERTKSWEVGADVRLWGNKLQVNATYYSSRTFNQVFSPKISSSSKYSQLYVNAGRVDNSGVELSAELRQNIGKVNWTSNIVYSRNRNKVVDMLHNYKLSTGEVISQDSMVMGGTSGVKMVLKEGGQMGDIYVNTLKTDEHGFIWVSPAGSTVSPDKDRYIYAGNSNPSYTMSWGNRFEWKGLSMSFLINARVGGVGVSLTQATMDYFGVSKKTAQDRDNGGALVNGMRLPADTYYSTVGGNGNDAIGACYVYSMTNVRLGELTLGYDIPVDKWCKWIKGVNVSFVGRNLWMLYCKAPFDPELASGAGTYTQGIDYFQQPSTRNLGFSVKLIF